MIFPPIKEEGTPGQMNLAKVLERNAHEFPDRTSIICRGSKITYRELNETVNRVCHALVSLGVKKGDRIGFMLPRIPELVIGFLAVAKAQAIAVPLNYELQKEKIRDILAETSPHCLILHSQFTEIASGAVPRNAEIPFICTGQVDARADYSLEKILKDMRSDNPLSPAHENDVVYLNYTSGSTGNPKGAVTTHANIYWNTIGAIDALHLSADDIHLCMFAPFAHPHEIFARPLLLGGTMVLMEKVYPKSIAETISTHGVTCMMGLAPLYQTLLELLDHKTYDLGSLRVPESGGMYTRVELIERFRRKTGVPIIPVWGSTETTGIAIANRPGDPLPSGSVGKPCCSYEVRIIDEHNRELPAGEIGEMIFKGPAVVEDYYQRPDENQRCFQNGWYYSGDFGKRDNAGNLYFIERKSGMMKVAGLKVYPMEVELSLIEHPAIQEVAIIAARDRLRGEVPKAIIVPKPGQQITEKEVYEFCREKLPHYKVPRIIEFREHLPKIGSGKINKRELQLEEISKP